MEDQIDRIINFVLSNITWLIFALFMLSGLFSRGGNKDAEQQRPQQQRRAKQRQAGQSADNRPMAERMAEAFGMQDLMEEVRREQAQQQRSGRTAQQGRRSTTTGNVQDNYPELFGGSSMFEDKDQQWGMGKAKWGFDETEWGSTFEKNNEQWGSTFPDRKSSEPRIEWPS